MIDSVITLDLETYCYKYLHDIIIVTETFEKHLEILEKVIRKLLAVNLTINREKSVFCVVEVRYLGILVNRDGFRPVPEKIAPILEYPAPKNAKQVQRFMGAASW